MKKKLVSAILCVLLALTMSSTNALAEETQPVSEVTQNTASAPAVDNSAAALQQDEVAATAGVTPDSSVLYTLEKFIESVQVTLTFNEERKAELLIVFANERLAEAQIMTEKGNQQLVNKVMTTYSKTILQANTNIKQLLDNEEKDSSPKNLIDKIEVVQGDSEKVMIKVTGILPQEQSEQIRTLIEAQVKMTLASKAYAAVKDSYVDSKKQLALAKQELEQALKTGDEAAISAASNKLQLAEENMDEMRELKKGAKELKKDVREEQKEIAKELKKDVREEQKEIAKEPKKYAAVQDSYVDSKKQLALAKQELEQALKTGDEAAISAASKKLQLAEENMDKMKELIKGAKELKKDVKEEQKEIAKEQREIWKEKNKEMKQQKQQQQQKQKASEEQKKNQE